MSHGRRAGTADEQQRFIIRAADDIPAGLRRRLLNAVLDVPMGRDVARLRRCSQNHHPWSRIAVPRPPPFAWTSRLILESIGRRSMARPPSSAHTPRWLTGLPCAFDQRPASTVITAPPRSRPFQWGAATKIAGVSRNSDSLTSPFGQGAGVP